MYCQSAFDQLETKKALKHWFPVKRKSNETILGFFSNVHWMMHDNNNNDPRAMQMCVFVSVCPSVCLSSSTALLQLNIITRTALIYKCIQAPTTTATKHHQYSLGGYSLFACTYSHCYCYCYCFYYCLCLSSLNGCC